MYFVIDIDAPSSRSRVIRQCSFRSFAPPGRPAALLAGRRGRVGPLPSGGPVQPQPRRAGAHAEAAVRSQPAAEPTEPAEPAGGRARAALEG